MNRICFVDLETTGLDPQRHEIWEIGIILRDGDSRPDIEYLWEIRPSLATADPMSLKIGRYYERAKLTRHPADTAIRIQAPDLEEDAKPAPIWAGDIAAPLASMLDGAYLAGAVPDFDARFLRRFLTRNGHCLTAQHRLICVENLVAGVLGQPVPQSLRKAAEAMGVKVDGDARHTAIGDARLARDVYDAVMGGTR